MASSAPVARAPSVPVSAPVSSQAMAQFQDLKHELGEHVSWELTSTTWDKLQMQFSEGGNEQQARTFVAVLK